MQYRLGTFWTDFLGTSHERQAGCARKRRAIPARGVSRLSWGRGRWDADALRDIVRECALETLADETAVLVIDETGFLKQGKASCGVARQYTGSAGKITNCQIGVFASYVSRHGHPSSRQRRAAQKNTVTSSEKPLLLICWSISGNPSYRDQARTTAHPTRPCHRVVTLATRSPG